MEETKRFEITSTTLRIMAMAFMVCDHLWATLIPANDWLTCVGRLTYPIFAFLAVEGYFHTGSLKKYVKRLFLFALLSEIPFNLVMGGGIFFPFHQNVLWSFLIGIMLIHINEKAKAKGNVLIRIAAAIITVVMGYVLGLVTMVDYLHGGVLTILVFYFFREKKWQNFILQVLLLWYINKEMLGGYSYVIELFGREYFFVRQTLAVLALVPIWLYRGKQGYYSKGFQIFCYAFYPVHLLIIALISMII